MCSYNSNRSTIILLSQKAQHLYIGMAFSGECTGHKSVLDLGVAHTLMEVLSILNATQSISEKYKKIDCDSYGAISEKLSAYNE